MSVEKKKKFTLTEERLAAFEAADPNLVFKPLTEETAADFKKVVSARFSPSVERQVDILLANPLRKYCDSVGDIAYEKGLPTCVQGAMLRRVYFKQTPYFMVNGSMFAKMPEASPVAVFGIMWRTIKPREETKFSFCNTAVRASLDISQRLVFSCKSVTGPASWCGHRVALIRRITALWTRFRSNHPRLPGFHWPVWSFSVLPYIQLLSGGWTIERRIEIEDSEFGPLWGRLLASNEGLLTSRSPDDLRWMYGSRLREGRLVLLTLKEDAGVVGFIVFRCHDAAGKRWSVVDMIAEGNDEDRLMVLMREAVRFLRCSTPAMELSIAGFPTWVQPTIAKVFSYQVKREHNPSAFVTYDEKLYDLLSLSDSSRGWFGGPVDGDAWL